MKIFIYLIAVLILVISCKHKNKNAHIEKEVEILNSCFLGVVDTFAYKYHTLRPAPNMTIIDTFSVLRISVYQRLVSLKEWSPHILLNLKELKDKSLFKEYVKLVNDNKDDSTEKNIKIADLKASGKYTLVSTDDRDVYRMDGMIGHLKFSRVLYNNDFNKALLVATIRDNVKDGIVKLFLLQKVANEWRIIKEDILEVW